MKSPAYPVAWFTLLIFCLCPALLPAKTTWDPIPPEDLALTECKSYPGASSEYLFYRITLDYASTMQNWDEYYHRIKIYDLRGAEQTGVLNIDYLSSNKAQDIYARVTKPDGRSTEYDKSNFTESVVTKGDGFKWMRQAFAIPDLGPGDILELKWSEKVVAWGVYRWWYCQNTLPTREFVLHIKNSAADGEIQTYNVEGADLKKLKNGQIRLEVKNVPPFEDEVYMPPTRDMRGWVMLLYTSRYFEGFSGKDIWKNESSNYSERFRTITKPGSAIKAKAAELIQGVADDEGKLRKLYEFCQNDIANFSFRDSPELQLAKKKFDDKERDDQSPTETLKLGSGYGNHINALFAALARAAGFEVRAVKCASRSETLKVKGDRGWLFMNDDLVAIRNGETWQFYSPSAYYVPFGILYYAHESVTALVCDDKKVVFEQTPIAPAAQTPVTRTGHFTLDAEGTLEGEVVESWGGHIGATTKGGWHGKTQEEVDSGYREALSKRLSSAEVSDLTWENLRAPGSPLIAHYKIRVPGYAELAGSRIVLVPSFFEHNREAVFKTEKRKYPIFFKWAWSEHDEVEITLPEGYSLDGGSAPANIGDPAGTVGVVYKLGYKPKQRLITYNRDFAQGGNSAIAFKQESYPVLKGIFDSVKQSDEHSLVLKTSPVVAATTSNP
jgi:hypothetical protein